MLVTVYIPTKNRLPLLKRAIDSVLNQSYTDIEVIVVDDGSTDGTREYLSDSNLDPRVRYIFMPASMGACVARNFAISAARGEFVTGLDDDDCFKNNRIEVFVEKWSQLSRDNGTQNIAGLFDSSLLIKPDGVALRYTESVATYAEMRYRGVVGNQVFAPKHHYVEAGLFDPLMPLWQDWDMYTRMAKKFGNFIGLNKCTYEADATHDYERITRKKSMLVRFGVERFMDKNSPHSISERGAIVSTFSGYPQVWLRPSEVFILIATGKWFALSKFYCRKLLGERKYEQIKFRLKELSSTKKK